ncbi:hypothetical protein GZH47_32225 (plasmid) [Paenibacillus rhizovicinus]|uniref:Uncharacterized protein n=1 Tax=Paenibacillus rhizovicinus TaxID=2704463 RepID=A0A6C0PAF3_9BACL|nr:hypothetical protein [Paenibacillus rhizovicinus]QHW35554.1 hypothetical protein GZH47_32225 [Paenibacillus rhizovicinus]
MSVFTRGYREAILNELAKCDDVNRLMQGMTTRTHFVLTHTHDESPRPLYLNGPYTADAMNVLVAFIQLESWELEETYGMDQTDVAGVLTQLYGCHVSETPLAKPVEIDLYLNWEEWCGVADQVSALQVFQNERLREVLQKYIDDFNKSVEDPV